MEVIKEKDTILISNALDFNITEILECGQIFSFKRIDYNKYFVISMEKTATVIYEGYNTVIKTDYVDYFYNFFDLNTNYDDINKKIDRVYPEMKHYKEMGKGIRILRQDPLQTIISFIVSANNNIKRIKNILFKISDRFGSRIGQTNSYTFPTLQQLSVATVEDFTELGTGYRASYLVETIKKLQTEEYDINKLKSLPTKKLKQKLIELNGVGPKVADCIMLFGFSRMDVFPVDTWIRKFYYMFEDKKLSDEKISAYFVNKFKDLSGYIQQYVYNFMINKS
ncbi:MAG: DNA-3-methyladenine glycosylase 2 family protein [Clostridia bacterium]|nr:DNA-3-methyladenine glycosylase 2 family protein [Clostridia bacterium]